MFVVHKPERREKMMKDFMSNYIIEPYMLLLILLLFLVTKRVLLLFTSRKFKLPPSPLQLPLIGNLHQLGSNPHRSLAALSRKYGPIMMLKFGQVQTLVISSPERTKDILRTYDHIFASRPPFKMANFLLFGGKDLVIAPYGEYWRQIRKIVTVHLLSSLQVKSFQHVRDEEVALMIAKVAKACASSKDSLVDMSKVLNAYANDIICRAVLGKLITEENINYEMFNEMTEMNISLFSAFLVGDYFPSLGWLDELFGTIAKAKMASKRWDELLDKIIDDHIGRSNNKCSDQERDFIDVLLSIRDEASGDEKISIGDIKAIVVDMFVAGMDTTYITLVWAMTELVRNSRVMEILQNEVRGIAKGKDLIKQEQLSQMIYLKAVIKEVLRLHPAVPLLIVRESMEDCKIANYDIPKKSRVIVNAWAISRDGEYWDEPEEFNPERFIINSELDYKGNHFQFTPFGSGRRICPGMQFAMSNLELSLANLVLQFDWQLPDGLKSEEMDMTEIPGITTRRKQNLQLVAKPWRPNI